MFLLCGLYFNKRYEDCLKYYDEINKDDFNKQELNELLLFKLDLYHKLERYDDLFKLIDDILDDTVKYKYYII